MMAAPPFSFRSRRGRTPAEPRAAPERAASGDRAFRCLSTDRRRAAGAGRRRAAAGPTAAATSGQRRGPPAIAGFRGAGDTSAAGRVLPAAGRAGNDGRAAGRARNESRRPSRSRSPLEPAAPPQTSGLRLTRRQCARVRDLPPSQAAAPRPRNLVGPVNRRPAEPAAGWNRRAPPDSRRRAPNNPRWNRRRRQIAAAGLRAAHRRPYRRAKLPPVGTTACRTRST